MPKLATTKFPRVANESNFQNRKLPFARIDQKIGSFPNVETFYAPFLEALRYHKVSKSGVAKKDNA